MNDRFPIEFFIIHYAASDSLKDLINIGVLVRPLPSAGTAHAEIRFMSQWDRILTVDPYADIDMLKALATEITSRVADESTNGGPKDGDSMISLMLDSFSNSIRLSEAQVTMDTTSSAALHKLMGVFVEPASVESEGRIE